MLLTKRVWSVPAGGRSVFRHRLPLLVCLALLGGVAGAGPAPGQEAGEVRVRSATYELSGDAELPVADGMIQLSVDEAVAVALQRNLGLFVERYNYAETDFLVLQNLSIYDHNTFAFLSESQESSPSASNLAGADVQETESFTFNLGWSRLISTGGSFRVDFNNNRFESNSQFATLNPSYSINLDATFSQPLLRNQGRLATERNLRIARTNLDISAETFEIQVINLVREVRFAYWDLVEAIEQLQVAEQSLSLARELHEQNRIKVEVGTLAPLELVQSEAGMATRQEELIRARAAVGDAADVLRQLLNVKDPRLWEMDVEPITPPETDRPIDLSFEEALQTALEQRPEIRQQRLAVQNLELDTLYFRNLRRPELNLDVTYGLNGLGGDITDRDFFTGEILDFVPGGYSDAVDQLEEAEFDGWVASLNFVFPVENRDAKAQVAIADIALERGLAELRDLELQVRTEVRRAARLAEAAAESVASARVSRHLEERNLEAEQKRYENGMSTSFQVLQIQEDLIEAASRYVSAVTDYRRALVDYAVAAGRLLEVTGVEIVGQAAEGGQY